MLMLIATVETTSYAPELLATALILVSVGILGRFA